MRLATPADDALLRRLMRENGMPSWVEMAIEREPSYFAGHGLHGRDWAVVAEEGPNVVGMYSASVAPLHVNGAAAQVGYLGGLRVQSLERHRVRHLRRGFDSIRSLAPAQPALPWWFTVVADENMQARRLLEAGLPGLPKYRAIGTLTTFAVAASRGRPSAAWRRAHPDDIPELIDFHAGEADRCQLSPVLDRALVERVGIESFWIHESMGRLAGIAALWDQRHFKQVVARRYHRYLRTGLPLYNAYAALTRRVALPPVGAQLAQSFIAFAAFAPWVLADPRELAELLRGLIAHCPTPVAAIGLHDGHPLVPVVSRLAPLTYRTRVYAVEFDEPAQLDGRPVQPEVALL
jgi:hypothetical protein